MEECDLRKRHLFALLAAGVVAALLPIPAAAAPSVTTIATGLDSPRGVAFFNGKLLVGEAGPGGGNCFNAPAVPFPISIANPPPTSPGHPPNAPPPPLLPAPFPLSPSPP